MSPSPAIIDLLLSEVILMDLAWVPISYVFVNSKSLGPTYSEPLFKKLVGPSHHIVIVTYCNMQIRQIIIKVC
jgi:hypothetical protein